MYTLSIHDLSKTAPDGRLLLLPAQTTYSDRSMAIEALLTFRRLLRRKPVGVSLTDSRGFNVRPTHAEIRRFG